ncbi:MAG TPA: YceI family protein [Propionibacteriaceae bacterium]|jgi:polyisoprenoid-binding protein YceI
MSQATATTELVAGTWAIDPGHSEVSFTVRHLMSKVRGSFADFSGEITTTGNPLESTVAVTITSASITTNNEQRDAHLRSPDFFDPARGSELTFVSTGVTEGEDGHVITGDLTINGITRSVDLAAEFLGVGPSPFGATVLAAEATTTINRKDYGVSFNIPMDGGRFLVGDKVEITLSIEATLA